MEHNLLISTVVYKLTKEKEGKIPSPQPQAAQVSVESTGLGTHRNVSISDSPDVTLIVILNQFPIKLSLLDSQYFS